MPIVSGYIPDKFGAQLIHIDSEHPLAARVVTEKPDLPPPDAITIEGGEFDGQYVEPAKVAYFLAMHGSCYAAIVDGTSVRIRSFTLPSASSRCPICERDEPHTHTDMEVAAHTLADSERCVRELDKAPVVETPVVTSRRKRGQ